MSAIAPEIVHWPRKRLKFCASYNDEVLSETTDDFKQIDYIEISDVSLTGGIEKSTPLLFHEAPSRARRKVRSGDILISTVRTYLKAIAAVATASDDLIASTGFCVVRPSDGLHPAFAGWVGKSDEFVGEVVARSVGVSYPAINASQLVDLSIPVPPLETQKRIAAFLDEKTAQIGALIARKQALLARLAEKRQAIITQAVTKGLNPAAPLKDSGIDWLGQIPAHWEVRRIKELGNLIGGAGFPHEYQGFTDLELPFFKVMDLGLVSQNEPLLETSNTIDRPTARALGASIIVPGDIVFAKVGAALLLNRFRKIGRYCCIDNNMMAFRPSPLIDPEFALQALSRIKFADIVNPGAVPSINGKQIGELCIARPPIPEQTAITAHILERSSALEYAEMRVSESLQRLAEYRAAIVTGAVTGQIEGLR